MLPQSKKIKVAFSVINCICYDQRVLKISGTVSSLGCEITIIGRRNGDCCDKDLVPFMTKRFRMLFKKGFLFYSFFNIKLFFYLLFHKYDLLVSNDLDTLLPNFLVSKIKRLPIIYDSHEYFTGLPEIQNRPFVRSVWKMIEKLIFPGLNHVMTVSEPIALLYEEIYHLKPVVVRNLSPDSSAVEPFSREEMGVDQSDLLVILQGTGINIDKGAEELINAVGISTGVSLLIVGSGDLQSQLRSQVKELNLGHKVKFIPRVPWKILLKYTKSADAGMCLEKGTNLNYLYSLPNKLFDYISAGIPIITGELPEIKRIVTEYKCGLIIPLITPEEISKAMMKLRDDRELQAVLKLNSVVASKSLRWENESLIIRNFYSKIIDKL